MTNFPAAVSVDNFHSCTYHSSAGAGERVCWACLRGRARTPNPCRVGAEWVCVKLRTKGCRKCAEWKPRVPSRRRKGAKWMPNGRHTGAKRVLKGCQAGAKRIPKGCGMDFEQVYRTNASWVLSRCLTPPLETDRAGSEPMLPGSWQRQTQAMRSSVTAPAGARLGRAGRGWGGHRWAEDPPPAGLVTGPDGSPPRPPSKNRPGRREVYFRLIWAPRRSWEGLERRTGQVSTVFEGMRWNLIELDRF